MIHYNVGFSYKDGVVETDELAKAKKFLADLKARNLIHDYRLLRSRAEADQLKLARFQAAIMISPDQFQTPFDEVARAGIHSGLHGLMIEHVDTFLVEVFDELTTQAL